MNHIEAMKQALEALESTQPENPHSIESKAIKSLRQAIAEAEKQEPVAWRYTNAKGVFRYIKHRHDLDMAKDFAALDPLPLYATPPAAQRQWVGLTLTEMENLRAQFGSWNYPTSLLVAVENILEKKNT